MPYLFHSIKLCMSLISTKILLGDQFVNFGSRSGCPFYWIRFHLFKTVLIENEAYNFFRSLRAFTNGSRWNKIKVAHVNQKRRDNASEGTTDSERKWPSEFIRAYYVTVDAWDTWKQNLGPLRIVASYLKVINTGWQHLGFLLSVWQTFILNTGGMHAETFENILLLLLLWHANVYSGFSFSFYWLTF